MSMLNIDGRQTSAGTGITGGMSADKNLAVDTAVRVRGNQAAEIGFGQAAARLRPALGN
jgi:hypothetical protein